MFEYQSIDRKISAKYNDPDTIQKINYAPANMAAANYLLHCGEYSARRNGCGFYK